MAPAAGTVLNALATGVGSAFAIDEYVTATVELDASSPAVTGEIAGSSPTTSATVKGAGSGPKVRFRPRPG